MRGTHSILVLLAVSCGTLSEPERLLPASDLEPPGASEDAQFKGLPSEEARSAPVLSASGVRPKERERDGLADLGGGNVSDDADDASGDGAAPNGEPARTRAWFPETFLWQPLVETGPDGLAEVPVRVPDRLTTWRVLGLAHTQGGSQVGSVHTFATVQDVYVDPVLPDHLHVGDRLELPVQAVNTSDQAVEASLDVRGTASLRGQGSARLRVLPGGTAVRTVSLQAALAGQGQIEAELGGLDKVMRTLSVRPVGKPHVGVAGGSLAEARAFSLAGPNDADAATQELSVQIYPGGLAVMQAELDRIGSGGAVVDPAFGFAVTSSVVQLAAATGAEVDAAAVRRVRQQSWQQLVRQAGMDPSANQLVSLVGALRDVSDHELAMERRDLWARRLVDAQRADGTWAPSDRGTIQGLVVQTAASAWVLPEEEAFDTARVKAAGALERLSRQVEDPYTAAVVVASDLLSEGDERDRLLQLVLDGISERSDGSRTVAVPPKVQGAFGGVSRAEVLAWTRLALDSRDDLVWRDDLVAEIMAGYGALGFGAGRADLVALAAIRDSLPAVTSPVEVVLLLDDEEVSRGTLDPAQPRQPLTLSVAPGANNPRYTLKVVGSAPGLAWTARLRSWTPWKAPSDTGVQATWTPGALRAGRLGTATLVVSAPGGSRVTTRAGLPAGTWVDLNGLRRHPAVQSAEQREDTLELSLRPLGAAEILQIPVTVQPTFAGTFATGPLSLQVRGPRSVDLDLPPMAWRVSL